MAKITATSMQSVFDLALQTSGKVDNIFDVIDGSSMESLDSDPTQVEVTYSLTNNYTQKYYTANQIKVSTNPVQFANTLEGALQKDDDGYLLQDNGYKILM